MNNLINKKFGRLLVLLEEKKRKNIRYFRCKCDCGNIKITRGSSLKNGKCKSCGCIQKEISKKMGDSRKKHGMSKTIFYGRWKGMFARCGNKYKQFKDYKGRGIKICDDWKDFKNFKKDMLNSFSEGYIMMEIIVKKIVDGRQ